VEVERSGWCARESEGGIYVHIYKGNIEQFGMFDTHGVLAMLGIVIKLKPKSLTQLNPTLDKDCDGAGGLGFRGVHQHLDVRRWPKMSSGSQQFSPVCICTGIPPPLFQTVTLPC
jgi:hypothetical protein